MLLVGEKKTYSVILNINQWTILFGLQIKHQHAQANTYQHIITEWNEIKPRIKEIGGRVFKPDLNHFTNIPKEILSQSVSNTHIRSKTKRFFLSLNNAC